MKLLVPVVLAILAGSCATDCYFGPDTVAYALREAQADRVVRTLREEFREKLLDPEKTIVADLDAYSVVVGPSLRSFQITIARRIRELDAR